jgi:hypothetical protein
MLGVFEPIRKTGRARPDRAKRVEGGQGRNRTSDTRIFSAVLYQLSYLAVGQNTEVYQALA